MYLYVNIKINKHIFICMYIGILHFLSGINVEKNGTSLIFFSIALIFAAAFAVRSMRPIGYVFPLPIEAFLSIAVFGVLHTFGGKI
jgi:hypothetical protein